MKGIKVQTWKMVVANLLAVLMVVMSVSVITPTTAYAASKKPTISKTTLKITEGKKYTLKIKNKIKKSSYKWSTSNKKVAKVSKSGVVTAVKKGKATITCKVKAPKKTYTLKCKVTVSKKAKKAEVKNDGTVTNQSQLDAALAGSASTITIKTTDSVNFVIEAGDYSNKSLVVDAPNADVTNSGKFASVEIKQIKSSTWYENAVGNLLKVLAANSRIVVGEKASASIEVTQEGATLTIVNNGEIKKVTISKKATVDISGASTSEVPVVIDVPGVKITTSVPLNLQCNAKAELVIKKGAEATKIWASSDDTIPTIIGTGSFKVKVGTGDNAKEVTVEAKSQDTSSSAGSSSGGSSTVSDDSSVFTFDGALKKVTSISVNYGNNKTFGLSGNLLKTLTTVLTSDMASTLWRQFDASQIMAYISNVNTGNNVTIQDTSDAATKKVTVKGNTFDVTAVNMNTFKIKNANGITVTLSKTTDDSKFMVTTSTPLQDLASSQKAQNAINAVNSISATYNNKTYTVECPEYNQLQIYINNEQAFYDIWPTINNKVLAGQNMTITATSDRNTKTVTVNGKVFTVSVNADKSVTVKNSSNVSATIVKGSNDIIVTLK